MSKSGHITTTIDGGSPLDVNLGLTGNVANPVVIEAGLSDIGINLLGDQNKPVTLDLGLKASGDPANPIAVDLGLTATGDPNKPIALDLGLNVHVDPLSIALAPLDIKLEPLDIKLEPLDIKLEPLKIDLGLDNINVCLSLAFTQFPRMQVHMPKKYDWGFSLFGLPVVGFSVCGESSFITEDNPPRVFRTVQPDQQPRSSADSAADVARDAPFRVVLS